MSKLGTSLSQIFAAFAIALFAAAAPPPSTAQQAKPEAKDAKPAPTEKNPAQIELLETKYRFETNGDSRKEVHTRVRINNELGARQFARLNFDFNRSFQSVEIPFVRVTHASGGTADILPSAITDNPNSAVVDYPAYHDVRVKSVRILGLQPDDILEYRVITTTTHHPLAPDFWLDHTFDRSGVVSQEIFELDLPASRFDETVKANSEANAEDQTSLKSLESVPAAPRDKNHPQSGRIYISADTPEASRELRDSRDGPRLVYKWKQTPIRRFQPTTASSSSKLPDPDIVVTSFVSWEVLAGEIGARLYSPSRLGSSLNDIKKQKDLLTAQNETDSDKVIYEFVSQQIKTIDLPLGATGFISRSPSDVLSSRYGTPEDKAVLLVALLSNARASCVLVPYTTEWKMLQLPGPFLFDRMLVHLDTKRDNVFLDSSLDVAPFGSLVPGISGRQGLTVFQPARFTDVIPRADRGAWEEIFIPASLVAHQHVGVSATLSTDGTLTVKVAYQMRGENELLLRVAFHKTEKEKWKDVAQMLALSDGFRGQILNVTASDPYATKEPFNVEYEISQPKFVDWSKKAVRIPAILPLPGLPDPPTAAQIAASKPIELGTPLAIDLEATIELPTGATAQAPIGTTVNRDYATFISKYSVQGNTLHASRSLHFLSSELPASRATDFNAFLHAVQSDQTQLFTVQPAPQK